MIYFGIAVYEEPWERAYITEAAQGSSIEEVEEKLENWITGNIEWDQEKKYYTTIVWILNPDGSVSYSTDL